MALTEKPGRPITGIPFFRQEPRLRFHAVTDWETRGIDPGQGHLHGCDIRDRDTPYCAGFSLRYFNAIPACLTEYGGLEWLEVIHPTRTKPLDALRIRPRDCSRLDKAPWA